MMVYGICTIDTSTLKKVTGQTRHKCLDTLTARLRIGTKEESSPERTG